jgi:hypothetical protein
MLNSRSISSDSKYTHFAELHFAEMPLGVMRRACSTPSWRASSSRNAVAVRSRSGSMFDSATSVLGVLTVPAGTPFATIVSTGELLIFPSWRTL